jgi:hypothetical protein
MVKVVETFEMLTGASGKVSHVPLPMMRAMAVLMKPFNPTMARLMKSAVVMDTRDMTLDASARQRRYPSIPATSLADVVLREYVQRTPAPLL